MKTKRILGLSILALFHSLAFTSKAPGTSGIEFFHGTFDQAKADAKKSKKLVFIDAYTTWCGPCKLMAKNVFTDAAVGEYYNSNFTNLKLDMETSEGQFVAKKYGVQGYPTFLFLDGDGNLVRKEMGYVDAKTFIGYGKSARNDKK